MIKYVTRKNELKENVGCDESFCTYRPGILFCMVLVARLKGFNVLALLLPCHASERPHFLNWVDGNHCCFLQFVSYFIARFELPSYSQFPIYFFITSASLSQHSIS